MQQKFGTNPADCTSFISPSIGPCHYEMDIWSHLEGQLRQAGVSDVHNPRVCTAAISTAISLTEPNKAKRDGCSPSLP